MTFIEEIEQETYDSFVRNHPKSHFLQSYAWGTFAKLEKNVIPRYVGLLDDKKKLQAAALLLEKKLPFGFTYFYAPRGYVIDFQNEVLLKEMTQAVKIFAKKRKGIFIKIDPDIIYNEEDTFGNKIIENQGEVITTLKKLGYKHLGFTKNFETMQPRYTFRIDLNRPIEEIESCFSKTTKQRIKKAEQLHVEVKKGNEKDLKEFYHLMQQTENRKDFVTHNLTYYETLYRVWNKDNHCTLFLGSVDLDKIIQDEKALLKTLEQDKKAFQKESLSKSEKAKKQELERRYEKTKSDLEKYQAVQKTEKSPLTLSAHFIIEYGKKSWVLYAGNHNLLSETYTNYKTYEAHLKDAYEKGIKIYDQFGTIGDLRKENPLLGLHEFKKKFGGDYIEFIGEFDYILNRPMYFLFTKLVPFYRNLVKKKAKKKNQAFTEQEPKRTSSS